MVRAKLYFKGLKNFEYPYDYDDKFSSLFFTRIKEFKEMVNKFKSFDFFTFSNFVIEEFDEMDDFFISLNGVVSVVVSSISEEFLKKFVAFLVDENNLYYDHNVLFLFKFEFSEDIKFTSNESNFITVSPIYLKNYPDDNDLFSFLENMLIEKYCRYYQLNKKYVNCKIMTGGSNFQKFTVKTESGEFEDYYYMLDLIIIADADVISFAYDVGLGNNTNNGFGMLDLYRGG